MSRQKSQPVDEIQFLLPGIHVNHSHKPGSASARKMTATSGRTSARLLHKNDPLGAFSKMFMVMSPWVSTKCYLTWKPMATPQGHLLFRLAVSMPRTEETESGSSPNMRQDVSLFPTPTAQDNAQVRGVGKTVGTKRGTTLGGFARMWPTPQAADHKNMDTARQPMLSSEVKLWPTPLERDWKHGKISQATADKNSRPLSDHVGGSLNPAWVEWLMGYPEGWTDLNR